ncbi:MAG TPA: methyltransferase domain-containing protein [Candidatus Saccharimonadales bacterium]|nr:methyltransferase domain-containing protein [Candidatus Saccharimonadales bacterium]
MLKEDKQAIVNYYTDTGLDYRVMLKHGPGNWAKHYGHTDAKHKTIPETLTNINERVAQEGSIKKGIKVLDAGCGIGGTSTWLAKNKAAHVVGVSIVPVEIKKAKILARIENVQNMTEFYVKDMRNTGFPAGSFDVVFAIESACHLEDKADFIKEAYRLLKPGGKCIVGDGFLKKTDLAPKEEKKMEMWLRGWAVPNLANINKFKSELERVGFKSISIKDSKKNVLPFSKYLYKWSIIGFPISKFLQLVKLRTKYGTDNVIAAFWQYRTIRKNLWSWYFVTAQKPRNK